MKLIRTHSYLIKQILLNMTNKIPPIFIIFLVLEFQNCNSTLVDIIFGSLEGMKKTIFAEIK